MNRHVLVKCVKIAGGSAAAILLAELLGLEYATSAGIITLLTLQDTRKATLRLSLYRIFSFVVTMVLAGGICPVLGYHAAAYGSVMLFVTIISYTMGWGDTISTNAVFCTHLFMMGNSLTLSFIWNEFQLLIIGAGIAVLLNWRMPDKEKELRAALEFAEQEFREIIREISDRMLTQTAGAEKRIHTLMGRLEVAKGQAIQNRDNTLQAHSEFYIDYFGFRLEQCTILLNFCRSVLSLREVPEQAQPISQALSIISDTFGLHVDVAPKLAMMDELLAYYQMQPLPVSRSEFEARALLYHGLKELESFLELRAGFMESLTREQRQLYLRSLGESEG